MDNNDFFRNYIEALESQIRRQDKEIDLLYELVKRQDDMIRRLLDRALEDKR